MPSQPYRLLLPLMALGLAATLAIIWTPEFFFTSDGAEHILNGELLLRWQETPESYPSLERLSPFTAQAFGGVYRPLRTLLDWRTAYLATVTLFVLLYGLGLAILCRSVRGVLPVGALLALPAAFNGVLAMGFLNYYAGHAFGFLILYWYLRRGLRRPIDGLLLCAFMLLQAWLHIFAVLLTGVTLVLLDLIRYRSAKRVGIWLLVGLPSAVVAVLAGLATPMFADTVSPSGLFLATEPSMLLRFVLPGSSALAALLLGIVVLGAVSSLVRRTRPKADCNWEDASECDADTVSRGFAIVGLVFLLAGLVVPVDITNWQYLSPRLLTWGLGLCIVALPHSQHRGGSATLFRVGMSILSLVLFIAPFSHYQGLGRDCTIVLPRVEAPSRDGLERFILALEGCPPHLHPPHTPL